MHDINVAVHKRKIDIELEICYIKLVGRHKQKGAFSFGKFGSDVPRRDSSETRRFELY